MKALRLIVRLATLCGMVWMTGQSRAATNAAWTMFQCNVQHTGQSPNNGPHIPVLKWKYYVPGTTGHNAQVSSPVVDRNNLIYFCSTNTLFVLNSSGVLQWSNSIAGIGELALSADESVLYYLGSEKLCALSAADGHEMWTFINSTNAFVNEPCIASNGTIYVANVGAYIYAVNPANGAELWHFRADGAFAPFTAPSLSLDQSTLYVGSGDPNFLKGGSVFALNAANGAKLWSNKVDNIRASGVTVMPNGKLLAQGQGKVLCLAPDNGASLYQSANDVCSGLKGALWNGSAYGVGNASGTVYGINAANGQTRWSYQTGISPDYDPSNPKRPPYGVLTAPIFGADGILYVGAVDYYMYALGTNGQAIWTYRLGETPNEKCPAIGPDSTLYISASDGYLYAIGETQAPPAVVIGPLIKANGSTNNITINSGTDLSVTVQLNPGEYRGVNVDWWVIALVNNNWYYLNSLVQWMPFDGNPLNCLPVYMGALFDLPATQVLNKTGLPVGSYTFWFAVHYPMDGILNISEPILVDSVHVTVQ